VTAGKEGVREAPKHCIVCGRLADLIGSTLRRRSITSNEATPFRIVRCSSSETVRTW
jgi:hypothetical protein